MRALKFVVNCICSTILLSLFIIFLSTPQLAQSQQLAFPTANGSGAYSLGGRGGSVSIVTNLNDSGPGSLRSYANVANTTIIFNVSGVINLSSTLFFTGSNVTIAGQTAPEGGITVDGSRVIFSNTDNLICRYIRFRGGHHENNDTVGGYYLNKVIFDHCSISFASDEAMSLIVDNPSQTGGEITVQNCLIAESKTGGIMGGDEAPNNVYGISILRNVYYNITHRFPNLNSNSRYDIINNYVHNHHKRMIRGNFGYQLNEINNLYDYGTSRVYDRVLNHHGCNPGADIPNIFSSGNTIIGNESQVANETVTYTIDEMNANNRLLWKYFYNSNSNCGYGMKNRGDQLEPNFFANSQHEFLGPITEILNATDLVSTLVPTTGASKRLNANGTVSNNEDVLDADWKSKMLAGVYASYIPSNSYIVPVIASVSRSSNYDTDNDGMPDLWEIQRFGNLTRNGTEDENGDGYTDLEEFLNQVDLSEIEVIALEGVELSPSVTTLNVPETISLTVSPTPTNATNLNGTWSSSDSSIASVDDFGTITSIAEGIATITFIANDGGYSNTAEITVTNIIIDVEDVNLNTDSITLDVNETFQAEPTFVPSNATNQNGMWISNDLSIASVSDIGLITGLLEGTTTITFTSEDGNFTDIITVTVDDIFFGSYQFYNAITDELIQEVDSDTTITLHPDDNQINFRSIPQNGDNNPNVESVLVVWNGVDTGYYIESAPIYAGMNVHSGFDFEPYTVIGGTYNFTVSYYSNDSASGDVVAVDEFSITFIFDTAPVANAGIDQSICVGETTTLTATGGTNYLWSTGENTASIEVNPTETTVYSVTVSNDQGEEDIDDVTVIINSIPIAEAGEDQTICEGESITLTATGGTSYIWSTGETTDAIQVNPILETTYSVEVISNNCSSTDTVTVFVNDAPDINVNDDVVIMLGESTTLSVNGSDNYLWSTGETLTTIDVSPIETTIYTVTSIGSNGCSRELSITVTVIPELIANAGEDVTICTGDSVTLNASGGVFYTWNTGDTVASPILSPTTTTTYTVTVGNDYGYTDTDSVTVFVNDLPDINVSDDAYVMIGNSTTLSVSGAETYLWSTGDTTDTITISPTDTMVYSVSGFSPEGCENIAEILVTVVEELNANAGEDVAICIGDSVTLNASGGVSYSWNNGGTSSSPTFTPTETTTYTVTVGDGFGNFDFDDVTVTVNPIPVANAGEDQLICQGETITLSASGGDSYLWSTGETTASINVSPNSLTTYTVDAITNNCSSSDDVTIFVNPSPYLDLTEDLYLVIGNQTTLTVNGAETYLWNTGDTTNTITINPTDTTTYSVTGFFASGCQTTAEVIVTVIPVLVADAGEDIEICQGDSVTLNASGGVSYSWDFGHNISNPILTPLQTTAYTVTVGDGYGNFDTDTVLVIVNEALDLNVSSNVVIVEGDSTTLTAYEAESYLWDTGETTSSITVSPNETTTYTVTGTSNTCTAEAQVTVTIEPMFVAYAGEDQSVCQNDNNEVILTANTGDSYLWNTGETTQSISVSPLATSIYTVTINSGSQQDIDSVTVYVVPSPNVVIVNGNSVDIMNGDFVTLSATGANTYEWDNGATQPNIAVSPSQTTTYEVRGYINECHDYKQVIVNVIPEVEANAGDDIEICLGDITTLTATGGDEYVWNTGEITQSIQVSPNTTTEYTVTVFNSMDYDEDSVTVYVDIDCDEDVIDPGNGEALDFNFTVFPNPTSEFVNVKLAGSMALSRIYLYDITGKLIHAEIISNENLGMTTTKRLDVSLLQPGMYYIKLVDVNQEISKKLIIK